MWRVEGGRPADGLAGVVDDEVEPVARRHQLVAERLDARRVPEVEAEDLEPVAPLGEVGLARVAGGGVAGEAGGDDETRAGPQQLEPGLVADLDPPAREQRHRAAQVGGLGALGEVELGARRAELVVEVMQRGEVRLADVAVLLARAARAARRASCTSSRGEGSAGTGGKTLGEVKTGWRRRVRMPVRVAEADSSRSTRSALPRRDGGADQLAAADRVGGVDVAGGLEEAAAVVGRDAGEEGAVGDDALEQGDGGAEIGEEGVVSCRGVMPEYKGDSGHLVRRPTHHDEIPVGSDPIFGDDHLEARLAQLAHHGRGRDAVLVAGVASAGIRALRAVGGEINDGEEPSGLQRLPETRVHQLRIAEVVIHPAQYQRIATPLRQVRARGVASITDTLFSPRESASWRMSRSRSAFSSVA